MNSSARWFPLNFAALVAVTAMLAGCAEVAVKEQGAKPTADTGKREAQSRYSSITDFAAALQCMDALLVDFAVRDITILVAEIQGADGSAPVATRDMLISAVSEMTRRGRSIRLVAAAPDQRVAAGQQAPREQEGAYRAIAQFYIEGSMARSTRGAMPASPGAAPGPPPPLGEEVSKDSVASSIGLDLRVLYSDDMSSVTGASSSNSAWIFKEGRGKYGDVAYEKFGVTFATKSSAPDRETKAKRGLVELSAIELMGRLTRTPYWKCLGVDPKDTAEVRLEMSDLYDAMTAKEGETVAYFQNQLGRRGFYQGPIDGRLNPGLEEATANYRSALGLSKQAVIDEAFFKAYLTADHAKIAAPAAPALAATTIPFVENVPLPQKTTAGAASSQTSAAIGVQAPPASAGKLGLAMATVEDPAQLAPGQSIRLLVEPNTNAHVYCYMQDENAAIVRFFPNRYAKGSFVYAGAPLELPGNMGFQILINTKGAREKLACFATPRDVFPALPMGVVGADFEPLPVKSLDEVIEAFIDASGGSFAHRTLDVQAKGQ